MQNITLSADENLIRRAREKAQRRATTLNAEFRAWLDRYVGRSRAAGDYETLMAQLGGGRAGGKFTRDEMNAR